MPLPAADAQGGALGDWLARRLGLGCCPALQTPPPDSGPGTCSSGSVAVSSQLLGPGTCPPQPWAQQGWRWPLASGLRGWELTEAALAPLLK